MTHYRNNAIVCFVVFQTLVGMCRSIAAADSTTDRGAIEFFEKRVRPVLVTHCQKCHGSEKQQNGLRVDSLAALLRGGDSGPAIVPGKPNESLLVGAIQRGELFQMPPKTKLAAAQIADLVTWVEMGTPWPDAQLLPMPPKPSAANDLFTAEQKSYWAFQLPVAQRPPAVGNEPWCCSTIDRFILAKLEASGLRPAPPADKRTLLRRATFDLLGLPPTPEELADFLRDESPGAFARVVDRLLASPRYGERWGRHWLDVARYADSNGMDENMAHANAFRYRDYVIAAFNRDKPYDQFVREQIAGDLLAGDDNEGSLERMTATGFLVIGPKMLAEDDPVKMEMDIVDEQLDTVGRTFLGLTIGCARCHDHKFDPLPIADYYSLAAIFKSTKTMANHKVVAMWNERPIAAREQAAERDRLLAMAQAKKVAVDERLRVASDALLVEERPRAEQYLAAAIELRQQPSRKPRMPGANDEPGVVVLEAEQFDCGNVVRDFTNYGAKIGVIYNAGPLPNFSEYDFTIAESRNFQLELRVAAADSRPTKLLLDGKLLTAEAAGLVTGSWQPDTQTWTAEGIVTLVAGKHTLRLERDGPFPHFDKLAMVPTSAAPATWRTLEQLAAERKLHALFLRQWQAYLEKHGTVPAGEQLAAVAREPNGPFDFSKDAEALLPAETKADLERLRAEHAAAEKAVPDLPMAMATSEGKVENLRVHLRGNYLTQDREVPRQFPRILAGESQSPIDNRQSGRRQLAEWMTHPRHPLTSRVFVNRVWHWHFGAGIVRSPDNFGTLGERPDNPPLLDWLAATFVEQGWSIKELHRAIMLSNTYRMSSAFDARAAQLDPENRFHWRHERRRLEAESLRDAVLAVCGELDTRMGGTLLTVGNHKYVTSTASENFDPYHVGRRSVYLPITRSSVYDFFQAFDFADPSMPNGQRATTTVTPQALALMNSRLMEDRTRQWGRRIIGAYPADEAARVEQLFHHAFSRPASSTELARALEFVHHVETKLNADQTPANDARERAWQSFCRVVLASSEFLYVE